MKRIDEITPLQCSVLCLILIQERANKHKLFSIFNTKINFKNKQAKNIFYLKIKLIQVPVGNCCVRYQNILESLEKCLILFHFHCLGLL